MPPPRQRGPPAPALDDSRSEASNGPRERPPLATKGRRSGLTTATLASKDLKAAATLPPPPTAAAGETDLRAESTGINWSTMPLTVLHQYRYVHNLPCPSSFSSYMNSVLLSRGIGLRSPTAIAHRRAARRRPTAAVHKNNNNNNNNPSPPASSAAKVSKRSKAAVSAPPAPTPVAVAATAAGAGAGAGAESASACRAQGRVSKEQLAASVRKHFNNTAISEQDAIARFVYKVCEESKGKEFRLRFRP